VLLRVCSVRERSGMECNGSIPLEWVGSILVFGWAKKVERNGSIQCSVRERSRMEWLAFLANFHQNFRTFCKFHQNFTKINKICKISPNPCRITWPPSSPLDPDCLATVPACRHLPGRRRPSPLARQPLVPHLRHLLASRRRSPLARPPPQARAPPSSALAPSAVCPPGKETSEGHGRV
jgi:hypothetical protein